jgi:hypothetical protein
MEFEESIYNLIPKEAYVPPKAQRHVSKHNPKAAPTSSTFCLKTTSKPGLSNLTGDDNAPAGHHTNKSTAGQFGLPKGQAKPDPNTFRLKNTGTFKLPESKYCLLHKNHQIALWLLFYLQKSWFTEIRSA